MLPPPLSNYWGAWPDCPPPPSSYAYELNELNELLLGHPGFNWWFSFVPVFNVVLLDTQGSSGVIIHCLCRVLISDSSYTLSVICLFPFLIH